MPDVILKLQDLEAVLLKLTTFSKDNCSPHTLDSQPSFVSACTQIKDSFKEILRYSQDFDKANFVTKKVVSKKITSKIKMNLSTMVTYTRMLDNLGYTHN